MNRKYIFGLILIVGMIAGMTTPNAIATEIEFSGLKIAFDISHKDSYYASNYVPLIANLTGAGNEVIFINDTWGIPDDVDALFLTQPNDDYTEFELNDFYCWFKQGGKLLWVAGDSDFASYNIHSPNGVLEKLGAFSRIASISIEDPEYNDGSAYRTAATEIGYGDVLYDELAIALTTGMTAGCIFHGPTAIMAFDGTYYKDLRYGESVFPQRINVIMTYGRNATALDSDVSDGWGADNYAEETSLDLYANVTGVAGEGGVDPVGFFPAIVHENMTKFDGDIIVSGEAIYSYYKNMYDQNTENGAYNGGVHFGQVLVNNILNYFLESAPDETTAFVLIPLGVIGVIYAISRRKK